MGLRPLFKKYGVDLRNKPTELEVSTVVKTWMRRNEYPLLTRQGFGIDIVDLETSLMDRKVGIELKGHHTGSRNGAKRIIAQLERYTTYYDIVVLLTPSPGLNGYIERAIGAGDQYDKGFLSGKTIIASVKDLEQLPTLLEEKIAQQEKRLHRRGRKDSRLPTSG
jgi:hypothetical protein